MEESRFWNMEGPGLLYYFMENSILNTYSYPATATWELFVTAMSLPWLIHTYLIFIPRELYERGQGRSCWRFTLHLLFLFIVINVSLNFFTRPSSPLGKIICLSNCISSTNFLTWFPACHTGSVIIHFTYWPFIEYPEFHIFLLIGSISQHHEVVIYFLNILFIIFILCVRVYCLHVECKYTSVRQCLWTSEGSIGFPWN